MHNPLLPLCLVAFYFLSQGNPLPASISNPLTIFQEPTIVSDGSETSLQILSPQQNHTHNITSLTASPFPIHEKVSNTEMTLYIHYTSLFTHTLAIERLLNATAAVIQMQAYTRGTKARLISNANGAQSFRNSIPKGLQLRVGNLIPFALEWGIMEDLVRGLREWCGYLTCRFQFSVGEGGLRLGEGEIF